MKQAEFHIRTEHDGVLALAQAVLIYRGAQGVRWRQCMKSRRSTGRRPSSPARR